MRRRRQTRYVTLKLHHDSFRVDRGRLLDAMKEFDRHYRQIEPISGTKFAVSHFGQTYPPKRVLGLAIGRPTSAFSGGEFANSVFRQLGLQVGTAPPRLVRSRADLDGPVPTIGKVLSCLFSQKWTKLDSEHLGNTSAKGGEFPGVYMIVYSDENLEGVRVDEKAVFYVGMTNHAGLKKRLMQFIQGLEDGGHHSKNSSSPGPPLNV